MKVGPDGLRALWSAVKSEAFRAELLPSYDVPDEAESIARWRRGDPPTDDETNTPWQQRVRGLTQRGVDMRRVRVVNGVLTEYQRCCIEWWYPYNEAAGERTYVMDRSTVNLALPSNDFWLLDDSVVLMNYDEAHRFVDAELAPPGDLATYTKYKSDMLAAAVPCREFRAAAA